MIKLFDQFVADISSYQISLSIAAIAVSFLMLIIVQRKVKSAWRNYFRYYRLVVTTIICGVFGCFDQILTYEFFDKYIALKYACHAITISILFLNTTFYSTYFLAQVGIDSHDKKWNIAIYAPAILSVIVSFTSPFHKLIYYYDASGQLLLNHDTYWILFLPMAYFIVIWSIICINYYKVFNFGKFRFVVILTVSLAVTVLLFARYKIIGFFTLAFSIGLIFMVYSMQRPDELLDDTGAIRRTFMFRDFKQDFFRRVYFTIVFVRITEYQYLADRYGEIEFNTMLSLVSDYLNKVHSGSSLYMLDAKTFALQVPDNDEVRMRILAESIKMRFAEEFVTSSNSVKIPVSILTMQCPDEINNYESFVSVGNKITNSVFETDKIISATEFLRNDREKDVIMAVKKAMGNNSFRVFYQPIYSTEKKKIVAAEALIRLFDDKLGFISPEEFIPLAEREGLILKIGAFVFSEVCRFIKNNSLEEKGIEYIEVNLSAVQCTHYKLAEEFFDEMKRYGIKPSQINFEITESSLLDNNVTVSTNIDNFITNGVELSLDDYGTGYSNISYLSNVEFSIIKVDKSLLWAADKNEKANLTLESVFGLAKGLNMKVVVEGVETEAHIKKLLGLNCDYFQGYYFSKPVKGGEFLDYIEQFTVPEVCKN